MENYKELEKRINDLMIADCYIERVAEDIENAKEKDYYYAYHQLTDIEIVKINVNTLEIEDASEYGKDDIKKAYAIKEYKPNMTLYDIMNKAGGEYGGQKIVDKYSFYDNMTKEDIIKEWLENDSDFSKEELEESFDDRMKLTNWGYIEV